MQGLNLSSVRTATPSDVREIVSIEREILEEDRRLMLEDYYRFRVENATQERYSSELKKKESLFIVAVESNQVVGVSRGAELLGGVFNIEFVGVRKSFRKKGIGEKLLMGIEEEAKKRDIHKITVQVYPDPVYTPFFEWCGYHKEASLRNHLFHQDIDIFSKHRNMFGKRHQ